MPRASRQEMEAHRAAMVEAASALVRVGGPAAVTVGAVSRRAGLTHGGFYKQFASKEALVVEALDAAVVERARALDELQERTAGSPTALTGAYLSPDHRDRTDRGCVAAALVGHLAADPQGALRPGFLQALDDLVGAVGATRPDRRPERVLADVALLVGALQLARATTGSSLSERFLQAARNVLDEGRGSPAAPARPASPGGGREFTDEPDEGVDVSAPVVL